MEKTISKKISVEASAENPTARDKTLGLEPAIWFYSIEDGDDTEEVEES